MPAARPDRTSGIPGDEGTVWTRRVIWLLAGVVCVRVLYAAVFPLDLAPDESYYWDWGRRPDIGYFSKPPMIGWLMGLAGWIGNDSMFVLKLFPGLLATAGLGFLFLLGRDLYGGRIGWWAVLLLLASPANVALSTFFTIDAPLFLCWTASLWLAWRWWTAVAGRGRWAAALALSLGLGYLTKQIQLVFPLLLLAFLAFGGLRPRPRGVAWQWLAVAGLSLLFLAPPVYWNWQHGWITFRHTADELTDTPFGLTRSLRLLGEFFGGQLGLGGGLTWILMVGAVAAGAVRWRSSDERTRFLVIFCLPGLLAFAALGVHQRVEQNWPMVFYSSAAVLAASRCVAADSAGSRRARWAVGIGGVLAAGLMVIPFAFPASPWSGSRSDPTVRIRGWRALAQEIAVLRGKVPQAERTFLLAPDDRYVASALAYYLPDHPRTYCWENPAHPDSQYGIWGRPAERVGWDAVVIMLNPESPAAREAAGAFASWEPLGEATIGLGLAGSRERRYRVFLGRNLRSVAVAEPTFRGREGAGGP